MAGSCTATIVLVISMAQCRFVSVAGHRDADVLVITDPDGLGRGLGDRVARPGGQELPGHRRGDEGDEHRDPQSNDRASTKLSLTALTKPAPPSPSDDASFCAAPSDADAVSFCAGVSPNEPAASLTFDA